MRVLSLFDGISCGQLALERAGIPIDVYYASEIDKYAIQVTQKKYPNTIQLGNVNNINSSQFIKEIDLIIGGSPCQNLSSINKYTCNGLSGTKSSLFYKFYEALKTIKPRYFMLENVASMKVKDRDIITNLLGIEPIMINSALVSAQTRRRLYWTNIPNVTMPQDKKKNILSVLEREVDDIYYLSDKMKKYIFSSTDKYINNAQINLLKARPLTTAHDKRANTTNYYSDDFINGGSPERIRRLTPIECERLQTLPDGYTENISRTQRYKCIGNGWTVDVIAHIFKGLKDGENNVIF